MRTVAGWITQGSGLLFAIGMTVTFNLPLLPGNPASPRASDAVLAVIAAIAAPQLGRLKFSAAQSLLCLGIGAYLVLWSLGSWLAGDLSGFIIALRLAGWLVGAYLLLRTNMLTAGSLDPILIGLVIGAIASATLSALQVWRPELLPAWSVGGRDWVIGGIRAFGLWDHPNPNAHVTMLGAAAGITLAIRRPRSALWLVASAVIAGLIYLTTQTRAALIIYAVLVAVFTLQTRPAHRAMLLIVGGVAALFFVVADGDALYTRWVGNGNSDLLFANAAERLQTVVDGLYHAALAPFGYGIAGQRVLWIALHNIVAVHNGYIFGILVFGWPFVPVAALHIRAALASIVSPAASSGPLALVALSSFSSLLFEDLVTVPSFAAVIPLTVLAMATAARRLPVASQAARNPRVSASG